MIPGTALPSERALAQALALSRMTIRKALEELVAVGLVEKRQGSGTYIRELPVEQTIDRLAGFSEEAAQLGFRPRSRFLDVSTHPADPNIATSLGVESGQSLLRITRLRLASDVPLALQVAHLGPILADLSIDRLRGVGSLYRTIEAQFGIQPSRARQKIASRLPTPCEQDLLEIGPQTPVLALERTTFDSEDRAFEFVRSAYRGDRYRMALDLRSSGESHPVADTVAVVVGPDPHSDVP